MSNTTSSANNSFDEHHFLPQLGFGSDVRFETIAGYHRYLFRVYTPKLLPAIQDESVFFVGSRFDYKFAPRTPIISEMYNSSCGPLAETGTYEDCIQHLNWETRSRSCFISTTFSFAWAIWDAVRRFETGVKHDVEIAVIDAAALSGKAVTTLQLLRKSPSSASKRHPHHQRWSRFAQESQSVLVQGFIPRSAVLASIPLRAVIQNLPSYFLKTPSSFQNDRPLADASLDIFAWDFTAKKHANFRRFCQEMSDQYTRMPYQTRVKEIAIGSVRLAMTMLSPWFHRSVENGDIQSAVDKIRDLSALIAHWPQQTGSRDFTEMACLLRALVQLLAEEVRSSSTRTRLANAEEISRLQKIVDGLLEADHVPEAGILLGVVQPSYEVETTGSELNSTQSTILETSSNSQIETPSSYHRHPRSELKIEIPESPTVASSSSYSSPSSAAPLTPESAKSTDDIFMSPTKMRSFTHIHPIIPSPNFSASSVPDLSAPPSPLILPHSLCSPPTPLQISIPLVSSGPSSSLYYTAFKSPPVEFFFEDTEESQDSSQSPSMSYWYSIDDSGSDGNQKPEANTLHDVVSYAVTGFLVGTLLTLLILSSQRRTLLYMT